MIAKAIIALFALTSTISILNLLHTFIIQMVLKLALLYPSTFIL